MPLPDPTYAPYGDHKVAYYSYGTGSEALVFVHGWTCDSSLWEPQQPLFEKYRTIPVDSPGHGRSDAPEDVEYTMEHFARGIKAALDHARIEQAVFVSHSMGGPVTTMLLRLFPEVVEAIFDSFFAVPEHYFDSVKLAEISKLRSEDDNFRGMVTWLLGESSESVKKTVFDKMMSTPKHVRLSAITTRERPMVWRWDEVYEIPALQLGTVFAKMDGYWKHHLAAD